MSDSLVIFGREPVPGRVKTRIAEAIGAGAAAEVYAVLLRHAIDAASAVGPDVALWLAAAPSPAWAASSAVPWEVQCGDGVGERMAGCFRRRFGDGADRVVIVGSDIARLDARHLSAAFASLDRQPVVLGPAADGGYWLVGQRAPGLDLFSGIPWSSPGTLDATRSRLETLGVDWHELETLPDIDTAADLQDAVEDLLVDPGLRFRLRSALLRGSG